MPLLLLFLRTAAHYRGGIDTRGRSIVNSTVIVIAAPKTMTANAGKLNAVANLTPLDSSHFETAKRTFARKAAPKQVPVAATSESRKTPAINMDWGQVQGPNR